ncbi:MAG: protein containing DUF447 [Candidatus Syntrophoarchaeum caldarius]|uniref:Protein containing DUF447 n=1 Tax=Candidatus Syntropharchaeum caldarium TaxID=1838285 RepID=A0A1F2PA69_9EURY|nr:MAG: protein containing DUF447 [Candidatus Syntrophoarchaeum caldarius]
MNFDLVAFGIRDGIWEVVATTRSENGVTNASPIGLRCTQENLTVSLYSPSRTLENVLETGYIGVNILHDPLIFVHAAMGDLDSSYFGMLDGFPVIRSAQGWIIFETRFLEHTDTYRFELTPIAMHKNLDMIHPVNRGFNALIEALIIATRYRITPESKREALQKDIDFYAAIVQKCGGEKEREAMELLNAYLMEIEG